MKSTTLYRFNPLLLKPDAVAEGGKATFRKDEAKPEAKAAEEKLEGKKADEVERLSPEELRKRQRELKEMTRSGRRKPEEKKADKPEEKPAAKPEEKVEEKKVEEKPAEKTPASPAAPARKVEPVDVPPPIGETEVATRKGEPEFKTELELRNADKRKLQVLKQMEDDGTVEKGFAQKTLKFWEKAAKYQENWEAQHPGEEFDDEAEEHKAFYKAEPLYDAEEFDLSRDNLVRNEARKETEGRQSEEQKVQKRSQEFKDAQPKLVKDSHEAVIEMITEAAPELAELMGKGDDRALTKEITEKMMAKDPVVTEILQETAEELAVLTIELHRLTQFDDVYQVDMAKPLRLNVSGRKIFPHAELHAFVKSLEAEMLKMDPAQTMRGKQRLVGNAQFSKEYQRITEDAALDTKGKREAISQLNGRYYTLTEDDFRRGLIAQYAAAAKADIEKFNKRHGHRTPKKPEAGAEVAQSEEKKPEEKEEKATGEETSPVQRTRSPSSASASDVVDPSRKSGKEGAESAKSAVARSRGR